MFLGYLDLDECTKYHKYLCQWYISYVSYLKVDDELPLYLYLLDKLFYVFSYKYVNFFITKAVEDKKSSRVSAEKYFLWRQLHKVIFYFLIYFVKTYFSLMLALFKDILIEVFRYFNVTLN